MADTLFGFPIVTDDEMTAKEIRIVLGHSLLCDCDECRAKWLAIVNCRGAATNDHKDVVVE